MTISSLLRWAKEHIQSLDAKILAESAFSLSKEQLLIYSDREISADQELVFRTMVLQRKDGHSVSEILGTRDFYGLSFDVTNDVLTPRPETEFLVDFARNYNRTVFRFIDVGTGSGCISIALAAYRDTPIIALDVSEKALLVAKKNAEKHAVLSSISFRQSDLLFAVSSAELKSSGILANLPYIPSGDVLDAEVMNGDPALALFSGEDGLDLYRRFFATLPDVFAFCAFEFHPPQQSELEKILTKHFPKRQIFFHADLAGDVRFGVIE